MAPEKLTETKPAVGRSTTRDRKALSPRTLLRGLAIGIPLLLSSGCVKSGISPKAHEVHTLFYVILWLALPVFVFVEGMLLICVVWFRRRRGDEQEPSQKDATKKVLYAFFAGPLAIVVVLLSFGESTAAKVDHLDPDPTENLVVTGFQWAWQAQYTKENFTVAGKTLGAPMVMELPVNEVTQVTLKATDVIHEFYVPDLLFMKNAVPGHPNTFTVKPTKQGTYLGQCAQYCGLWHEQMKFTVKVVSRAEFEKWTHQQQKEAKRLAAKAACTPNNSDIELTAHNISWDKTCVAVVGGKPFKVEIHNLDNDVAHNFGIWQSSALKKELFHTKNLTGPAEKTYKVPILPPGKYYFQCDVHGPAMSGTLIIGDPQRK
jgi:cytochrome c oxidase subunit II